MSYRKNTTKEDLEFYLSFTSMVLYEKRWTKKTLKKVLWSLVMPFSLTLDAVCLPLKLIGIVIVITLAWLFDL